MLFYYVRATDKLSNRYRMKIDTKKYVESLDKDMGVTHIVYVPCSFMTHLINGAIQYGGIEMISAASEGVACAIASGLKMAGKTPLLMMQSSGFTNASSPFTSLVVPYNLRIPTIISQRTYTEGASEIQHKVLSTNLRDFIEASGLEIYDHPTIENLKKCNDQNLPAAVTIVHKDTFSEVPPLDTQPFTADSRIKMLKILSNFAFLNDAVIIGTTGHTARELSSLNINPRNFLMTGAMGLAASIGLGAALAGDNVIVAGGDGEFPMHLGGLTNIIDKIPDKKFLYILFDNGVNKSTGKQETPRINFSDIASAIGFNVIRPEPTASGLAFALKDYIQGPDVPTFLYIKCGMDPVTPRPDLQTIINSATKFKGN